MFLTFKRPETCESVKRPKSTVKPTPPFLTNVEFKFNLMGAVINMVTWEFFDGHRALITKPLGIWVTRCPQPDPKTHLALKDQVVDVLCQQVYGLRTVRLPFLQQCLSLCNCFKLMSSQKQVKVGPLGIFLAGTEARFLHCFPATPLLCDMWSSSFSLFHCTIRTGSLPLVRSFAFVFLWWKFPPLVREYGVFSQ